MHIVAAKCAGEICAVSDKDFVIDNVKKWLKLLVSVSTKESMRHLILMILGETGMRL